MREFYPFMRVQVSTITMRENIFRYFYGSHQWLAWLARLARMACILATLVIAPT